MCEFDTKDIEILASKGLGKKRKKGETLEDFGRRCMEYIVECEAKRDHLNAWGIRLKWVLDGTILIVERYEELRVAVKACNIMEDVDADD